MESSEKGVAAGGGTLDSDPERVDGGHFHDRGVDVFLGVDAAGGGGGGGDGALPGRGVFDVSGTESGFGHPELDAPVDEVGVAGDEAGCGRLDRTGDRLPDGAGAELVVEVV